jgi:hypothetical protein
VGFDPGVVACGVAMFTSKSFPIAEYAQTFRLPKEFLGTPWPGQVAYLAARSIYSLRDTKRKPGVFVVEFPRVMAGSRGAASAARGDVLHLAHFCGLVHAEALGSDIDFAIQDAGQWKGQLKKEIVEERLSRLINFSDKRGACINSHAWDACGVALAHLGVGMDDIELLGANS